ncbi:MAG: hypothetical protein EA409_00220 [Saprospirales bacterium]|nr:MAG: hypothetical protein EA409_00220 [Saprospirales bacterium]
MFKIITILLLIVSLDAQSQSNFNYEISLVPVSVDNLPGLHSYAFAQHQGKWVVIGGRRDGIHARQPFNAFPQSFNNSDILVIDPVNKEYWSSSVEILPLGLREQLQSTNMNFYQDGDHLIIIGGYAYSPSANDHITFPKLAVLELPELVDAIINGSDITPFFSQQHDERMAVTGGQLGKLGDYYYLVGGHRFDGRYNPHGPNHGPGFSQEYTNQIRKFRLGWGEGEPAIEDYSAITDAIHLRRRDYNLVPQILADDKEGYMISSGVFQINEDLPFLYPVYISEDGYEPIPGFNQYLSNYHSPKVGLYDSNTGQMHNLFFGGISQYYYENGELVRDDLVPFVNTISLMTRHSDGSHEEFVLPIEMPGLRGASAEFIVNPDLPQYQNKAIKLSEIEEEEFLLGYIYGGIYSPIRNAFATNQTHLTEADDVIYEIRLKKDEISSIIGPLNGSNPYSFSIFPNPADDKFTVSFPLDSPRKVDYFITDMQGKIFEMGYIETISGENILEFRAETSAGQIIFTLVFENKYYVSKTVFKRR